MRDSNPHGLRHQILSLACLPISAIARMLRMTPQGFTVCPCQRSGMSASVWKCLACWQRRWAAKHFRE
jgi:hypothetical protein